MISSTLKRLKSNFFGKPGRTGFAQPGPTKTQGIGMTSTPTGLLDSDPLRFGTYQFPRDVFENQQLGHYMVFYVNVQDRSKYYYGGTEGYNGPDAGFANSENSKRGYTGLRSDSGRLKVKNNKITGKNSGTGEPDLSSSSRNSATLQGVTSKFKTTTRISDSIALYLPANVTDTTSARYDDSPTGILGMAAKDLKEFVDIARADGRTDYEALGIKGGDALKKFSEESLKRFGGALAESLAGAEGAIPLANRVFGRADNPFVEVFFNTMNVRTFTYNFNFAPRSAEETDEVQQIIQLFRFHMAPELQINNSRYYTLPATFDIHYMYKSTSGNTGYENDYFNRIGTCVLENVNTNYTPNGVKSFADGAPTQITMSLTFKETEVLTKAKINEGY